MLLVFIDCVQIHLEGPIRIQVEKQGCLEDLIMNFSFDFFDRVFQWHLFQSACNGDCLLDHLLAGIVQVGVCHAINGRGIKRDKSIDQVRVHACKCHGRLGPETVAHQCHILLAIVDACLTHITLNIRRQRPVVHHRVPLRTAVVPHVDQMTREIPLDCFCLGQELERLRLTEEPV